MDAIVHVVRCFEDDNIIHVDGSVDPARDIETIETELILADLESVEKRRDKAASLVKKARRNTAPRRTRRRSCSTISMRAIRRAPVRSARKSARPCMAGFCSRTSPCSTPPNIAEDAIGADNPMVKTVEEIAARENGARHGDFRAPWRRKSPSCRPRKRRNFCRRWASANRASTGW